MDKRKTILALLLLFFTFTAAAQTSFNDLVGSQLTVEESLVNFVNTITSFEVESAAEVLLYLVAPLFGFYYLTLNFMSMSYELFEDRIDRDSWDRNDEDIPSGMKGFALITSFITVLFLGTLGAGLLLFAGLTSFLLAVLMMSGLFNEGLGNGNNEGQQTQQPQQGQQTQQPTQQNGGGGLQGLLSSGADFLSGANQLAQTLGGQGQQQTANQIQESLRFFDNDFIKETDQHVISRFASINSSLHKAENELSNPNKLNPDVFKNLGQRANKIDKHLGDYLSKHPGRVEYFYSGSSSRDFKQEIYNLENQIKRILNSNAVTPPDDVFNDILNDLEFLMAVAHFAHYCPIDMSAIATDRNKAEKVISEASSMNKVKDISGRDEANKLMNIAGWIDSNYNVFKDTIETAERVCKRELEVSESEMNYIKGLLKSGGNIETKLHQMNAKFVGHSDVPTSLSNDIIRAESKMNDIQNELASLEGRIDSHGKFESNVYKKLKDLESKM